MSHNDTDITNPSPPDNLSEKALVANTYHVVDVTSGILNFVTG